jgi:hydroxyethylthiazole kinase-like sugar kinase family protein
VHHAGLREEIQPMVLDPVGVTASGINDSVGTLVLRTGEDPTVHSSALRSIVARANASVPVVSIRTMET